MYHDIALAEIPNEMDCIFLLYKHFLSTGQLLLNEVDETLTAALFQPTWNDFACSNQLLAIVS